jgi:purine-binding chemotaxis protein CheW
MTNPIRTTPTTCTVAISPDDERRLLRERARLLAREIEPEKSARTELKLVAFKLAEENYAIESSYVREVYPLKSLTPLPGAPSFVLGLTNLRGEILSIVDLHAFFELPNQGLSDRSRVIVLRSPKMEFGILADSVLGTREIAIDDLQPTLPTLTGIREEYFKGVTGERLIVLDADRLLTSPSIIVNESV